MALLTRGCFAPRAICCNASGVRNPGTCWIWKLSSDFKLETSNFKLPRPHYFDPRAEAIVKMGRSRPKARKPMAAATAQRITGSIRRTA